MKLLFSYRRKVLLKGILCTKCYHLIHYDGYYFIIRYYYVDFEMDTSHSFKSDCCNTRVISKSCNGYAVVHKVSQSAAIVPGPSH